VEVVLMEWSDLYDPPCTEVEWWEEKQVYWYDKSLKVVVCSKCEGIGCDDCSDRGYVYGRW